MGVKLLLLKRAATLNVLKRNFPAAGYSLRIDKDHAASRTGLLAEQLIPCRSRWKAPNWKFSDWKNGASPLTVARA